ncbi:MAG: hypothetical protein JWL71_1165 [Acidobacteria bacterium]|nr:hypothetical protein [Acidobacteriota bacterium]
MKKGLLIAAVIAVAAIAGYVALRPREARRPRAAVASAPLATPSPTSTVPPPAAAASAQGDAGAPMNIASPEFGGHIELATSEADHDDRAAIHVIDRGLPEESTWSAAGPSPQEVVIGFFDRQPARISAIVFNPNTHTSARWARDVEAWTSMESATSGFTRLAALTLQREDGEQTMTFPTVEARFVKIRILSQYLGDDTAVGLGKVKVLGVLEGAAARAAAAAAVPLPLPPAPAGTALPAGVCEAGPPAVPPPPAHGASARVLVLSRKDSMYPPLGYSAKDAGEDPDTSIFGRITFTRVPAGAASVSLLDPAQRFDTVVLSQVCDIKTSVPDSFKAALVAWVGQGHKLIVHDSDVCDAAHLPDYSFLPYPFATSNPGKRGAESQKLTFVEENTLGRSSPRDPAFLDLDAWTREHNELGDSNTVTTYDDHWCGDLMTRNVLNINGFVETYAHYGRGLIIYDGFDYDQASNPHYRRLVTHELSQPFDPDGLQCTARLSNFVLTTDTALRTRFMAAGQTFRYPVTLLSNQGYKGTVHLSAAAIPADPAIGVALERDAIDLTDSSDVQLTVTTSSAARVSPRVVAVKGTDDRGRTNILCLRLDERATGGLRVTTDFPHPARPVKNLEIILDLSGSMKLPLGKSTRIATARRVLRDVVAKLPDDFNVGLRVYGHRYGSRQKETCTDSELVVPIQKLNRDRLLAVVDSKQPRGETPLVYSVLQTAADLKAAGGGSVVLITDGEESCHGDPAAAARELKASGVDINLQILGFTLTGQQVQQELSRFAEATGGRYYSAQDGEALARALLMAAVDKMSFVVLDGQGHQVGQGETDSSAIELPPGEYTVVVRASTGELRADHVAVQARGDSVVKVALDAGRLQLRR